jgi:hypothetical protein
MSGIRGQLALLGGALMMGAFGGAAFVHFVSAADDDKTTDATSRNQETSSTERDERRSEQGEHHVPTSADDGTEAAATSNDGALRRESDPGVPLSDVLSRLESQYQANLRHAEREQASSYTPEVVAETAPPPAPVQAPPQVVQVQSVPAEPQQVVVLDVSDVDQVNVNPGTVNVTHVTENHSNGVAVSASYPYYPIPYVAPQVVAHRDYPNVYPGRTFYPQRGVYPQPGPVTDRGRRYDSMKPPPGPDSPMFPAHASASLGPIFGGLP